jgi:hypothetical protein
MTGNGGGSTQCPAGDDCCRNPATGAESCSSSCQAPADALDCTGNTGSGECASGTLCCGKLVTDGGMVGSCTASVLSSSCQTTCADNPPTSASCGTPQNPLTYTLRLCSAKADCASDGMKTNCCAYNNSSVYWCIAGTFLTTDCKQ